MAETAIVALALTAGMAVYVLLLWLLKEEFDAHKDD
jgi:hypothetical protein